MFLYHKNDHYSETCTCKNYLNKILLVLFLGVLWVRSWHLGNNGIPRWHFITDNNIQAGHAFHFKLDILIFVR